MIRLYDFELSGCCYKVRLLLNILKVSCERVPIDFPNQEHKADPFLKLNPLGEVPVMEDGEVRLREAGPAGRIDAFHLRRPQPRAPVRRDLLLRRPIEVKQDVMAKLLR